MSDKLIVKSKNFNYGIDLLNGLLESMSEEPTEQEVIENLEEAVYYLTLDIEE